MSDGRFVRAIPDSYIERAERKLEEIRDQYRMEISFEIPQDATYVDANSPYHHLRNGFRHGAPLLAWLDGLMSGFKEKERQDEVARRRDSLADDGRVSYIVTNTGNLFHVWYRQGQRALQRIQHPSNPAMSLVGALAILQSVAKIDDEGITVTVMSTVPDSRTA